MRCVLALLVVSLAPMLAGDGADREVLYAGASAGAGSQIPTFDNGYLIFVPHPCDITVYAPNGKLAFSRRLTAPGERQCSAAAPAADTDGTIAVSIGYFGPEGRSGGILLLNSRGEQTGFIETKRYISHGLCFDGRHALWSIGGQRDQADRDTEDKQDYPIVRRFSRSGKETGAYISRSLWPRRGAPGSGSRNYWRMAAAKDRIGAIVYENHADNPQEWIEWDLDGKLLTRVPVPMRTDGGRAFTAGGRLYVRSWDQQAKRSRLQSLDRATGVWKPVSDNCGGGSQDSECGMLMGADGDHLVFRRIGSGLLQLLWVHPETE